MIPKPGKDHKNQSNYRPISLLNTLAKVLESTISFRLKLAFMHKICPEQLAFHPGHSTSNQLLKLIDYLTNKTKRHEKSATLFLDFEKAFDKVWREGLIYELITLRTNMQLAKIINSFLTNRTYTLRVSEL